MKTYIEHINESYARVYAEKQNTLLKEHHGEDWPSEVLQITLNELLEDLSKDKMAKNLYDQIEAWIENNYLEEVEPTNATQPEDLVDLTFNKNRR